MSVRKIGAGLKHTQTLSFVSNIIYEIFIPGLENFGGSNR